jgi:UDP-3-O-acyl-N-acetylglucosamine deacetylase
MERARAFMQCLQGVAIINNDIGALDAALPVKSGHALNNQLVRALFEQPECWEWATFDDPAESPVDWTLSQDLQFG